MNFAIAQQSNKLSPAFRYIAANPLNAENEATYPTLYKQAFAKALNNQTSLIEDGYICIIYTSNSKLLIEKNINVQSVLPKFVAAWITPQQLQELTEMKDVQYIDVPKIILPNNDIAVGTTGASLLQAGKLNNTSYKGDGVIVGVFDTGIDWLHLDFRSPTDTTKSRILKIWDQTITPITGEASPSGFNYGVEYTQTHINNEIDGTPVGYVREKDINGHGTHVAGSAVGNGAALATKKFAGIAPNADIVFVKGGNSSFSDYNEINAMTYFQNVANALGKPIVVNMSIGGQFGAHDGTNPDEIAVDNFCSSAAGRVACISAGNDNGATIHRQVSIAAGGSANVVVNVPTASGSTATDVFQISLYVNDTNRVNAVITLPNGSTITANAGQSISPSVLSGAATAYFDNYIDADSKDRLINLYVVRSSTSANPSGTWTITLNNVSASAVRIDGWLNYKGTNFGSTTVTGADNNYLVGSPGNCTNAITVASYVGKLDWYSTSTSAPGGYQYSGSTQQDNISTFSSIGPRRDDTQKPTIAATGQAVVSCLARDAGISATSTTVVVQGLYRAIQGTSMSSPVVAGCVALMLQAKPTATFTQIRNAITATATKDNFTGANTNYIFGAGKIDVFKAASSLSTCTTFKRETYSYDSSVTGANNTTLSLGSNKAATRFTPLLTGKLGGVYFKTGSTIPTNSFTIEVRSSDGTNPATLLGSLSVTPASIARFSWNYYDVTSLNINVTNGTDYWIVLVPGASDSWGLGYESLSVSGRSKYFNGSSWIAYNDFRIRSVVYNNDIPTSSSITNVTACNDYTWNGTTYTASGTYTYTTPNAVGCDSVATLNLTVNQNSSSTTNASVCSNQLPYNWNGQNFTGAGSYVVHLTNSQGCDSAATLNLTVNAIPVGSATYSGICSGQQTHVVLSGTDYYTWGAYQFWGAPISGYSFCGSGCGNIISQTLNNLSTSNVGAIRYAITPVSSNGCAGNIFYADVAVNPRPEMYGMQNTSYPTTQFICSGNTTSIDLHSSVDNSTFTWVVSGNFNISGYSGCSSGCSDTIKQTLFNNTNLSYLPVTYTITPTSPVGCVGSSLDIKAQVASNVTPGVSIAASVNNVVAGTSITIAATPENTGTTTTYMFKVNGVTVQNSSSSTYTSNSFNNNDNVTCIMTTDNVCQTSANATSNAVTIITSASCTPNSSNTSLNVCSNQLPYSWNNQSYAAAGSYLVHLTNAGGCDSAATLNLTVDNAVTPSVTISTASNTICSSSSATFNASSVNGGSSPTYQWKKNGINISTGTTITFAPNTLTTGDVISCTLTANNICQTTTVANSNTITITVAATPNVLAIKNGSGAAITNATMCTLSGTMNLYNATGGGVWSSDNTGVATVSNGVVTAVANGTTNIKYTVTSAANCSAFVSVTINVAALLPPSSIVGASNLCVGSSTTYSTASTGGVWSTLGRASITNGGVATGTSAGTTSIIYTITNGAGCSNYTSLGITIFAIPAVPTISFVPGTTGISGSGGYCKNKTFGLVGNPSGGAWSSTGAFSITTGGVVTTSSTPGPASVTYAVSNSNGCVARRTVSTNVVACKGVNIQPANNQALIIYPNPAHSMVNIKVNVLVSNGKLVVTDCLGRGMKEQALSMGLNTIDVSGFAKGLYFVSVITEQGKQTHKLVIE